MDSSLFQGGKSHVELLNAVSRDNYTMITYRRPLKSSDTFDVRILTNPRTSQNIFWSVGYKSSAMRKKFKPDKNIGLVQINFGRRPQWNCPKGEDEEDVQAESIEAEDTFDFTFSPSASEKINAPSIIAPNVPKTSSEVISRKNGRERIAHVVRKKPKLSAPDVGSSRPAILRKPQRKPQSKLEGNVEANNWSDWFSPPTYPEAEVGGFQPELRNKYSDGKNGQYNSNKKHMMPSSTDLNAHQKSTGSSSIWVQSTDTEGSGSVRQPIASVIGTDSMKAVRQKEMTMHSNQNNKNRKFASEIMTSAAWDVPPITCFESKTNKKPLYIQLGPSAMHRGNKGMTSKSILCVRIL